jgi:hypothetical protein
MNIQDMIVDFGISGGCECHRDAVLAISFYHSADMS